ncbi:hypothetical protein [Roseococcus pinisoli]|nr:hypothetical protein [Roseococcus pinisoli]
MREFMLPVVTALLVVTSGALYAAIFIAPPAHWSMNLANGGL